MTEDAKTPRYLFRDGQKYVNAADYDALAARLEQLQKDCDETHSAWNNENELRRDAEGERDTLAARLEQVQKDFDSFVSDAAGKALGDALRLGDMRVERDALVARVEELQTECEALWAQTRGRGYVPYLDRMKELAQRAEKAEAARDQLKCVAEMCGADADKWVKKYQSARDERDRLRAELIVAKQHKMLSLLGKSQWTEVVEQQLRTELAEAQVKLDCAKALEQKMREYSKFTTSPATTMMLNAWADKLRDALGLEPV